MPLIQDSHDSLPYIDPDISLQTRSEAEALVTKELSDKHTGTPHPLLPQLRSHSFSPCIAAELERVSAQQPLKAIDTSRYEALEPPTMTDPTSDETRPQLPEAWTTTLQKAYASSTHLHTRLQNLALLERFGKNAWLVGNSQLEEILKGIEKDLVETREQVEQVGQTRQYTQEGVKGEMESLDDGWRKGVGRLMEVQVASEHVKSQILEKRRQGAV
ncbi:hypothetical protein MMC13_005719 [Lambiella insularis]|nr:hypothetical protein [Lambiella insularis]